MSGTVGSHDDAGAAALRHAAMFIHGFEMGGAQRRVLAIAGEMARSGIRTDLCVASTEGPLREEVPDGVSVVDLGRGLVDLPWIRSKRRRRVRAVIGRLAAYLRTHRPQVLVAGANHVALAAVAAHALAGCGEVRLVLRASNHLLGQGFADAIRRRAIRLSFGRADAVVAVSNAIAAELEAIQPSLRARTVVIPNPVIGRDHARRCEREIDHAWLRPGGPPLVLGVGRLAPQKGFATLIQAFALVRERRRAHLLILGEGPERPVLAERAAALGLDPGRCLPGSVADPLPFMARAGVFVLSSAWEGMPGTLIEAMGCGCPVVSTDCPGGSSELLRGGDLGPLVPVGDHRAMADAIDRVLDAPVSRDLLRAAVLGHGVELAGRAYVSTLERVLGGPRRAEPADDRDRLGG